MTFVTVCMLYSPSDMTRWECILDSTSEVKKLLDGEWRHRRLNSSFNLSSHTLFGEEVFIKVMWERQQVGPLFLQLFYLDYAKQRRR